MTQWFHHRKLARIAVNECAPNDVERVAALTVMLGVVENARWPMVRGVLIGGFSGLLCAGMVVWLMADPGNLPDWWIFAMLGLNGYACLSAWVNAHAVVTDWTVARRALREAIHVAVERARGGCA